ncbi:MULTISPECIES: hypothetical protein [unclassified Brevibacterium]|uniref:hypothetical protein n=1 Tax=unclassified Brevibacterium TaxID=2614124 RepID=UPI001092A9ED|nr:hypothetical protein [Brevibacterium sp. S22]TGD30367.1 hypothetical protein EB835_12790 [Brevibacterium sp. S22]
MTLTTSGIESLFAIAASAPSAHNTQPWVPEITDCTPAAAEVRVCVDPARALPHGDPRSEDLHLSMGCWVESLTIAAAEAGVRTESVTVRGHGPTLDIRLRLAAAEAAADPTGSDSAAAEGSVWPRFTVADLHHRQVDRGPLDPADSRIAEATAICRTAMAETGVRLVEIPDRTWRAWLRRATLHSYGDRSVFAETLRWLRFDARDPHYHQDGLTAECLRLPTAAARAAAVLDRPWLHPWIVGLASAALTPVSLAGTAKRSFARTELGSRLAALPHELRGRLLSASAATDPSTAARTPHHLVLSVIDQPALSAADEVEIGRILLRIWLTLDRHGLRVDVHSELKDSPTVRSELASHLRDSAKDRDSAQTPDGDQPRKSLDEESGGDRLVDQGFDRPIAAFTVGVSTKPVPRAPRLSPL